MVALIVILAIAIPIYVGTRPDPTKISNLNPRQRIIRAINESDSNTVPVVQWDPDLPFAQTAAKIRHPIVLRNTYATKWKAMKKWSPKYLQERMKDDSCTVFYSNDPIFIYHETEGTLKFEGGAPYHRTSMTISQFFNKLQDSNDPAYYYLIHPTTSPSISADFNTTLMELPSKTKVNPTSGSEKKVLPLKLTLTHSTIFTSKLKEERSGPCFLLQVGKVQRQLQLEN
eukprot:TRINITY_DN5252_c0_g1_i1.p1 TRINITY_DN5252_c0_g1~~TRINITY_DN5252_c0_g1_i1.p1  ORF type:complete len:263 (+),score=64.02 TRINITY_DN5252_c0_g1_i1:107-790(+)